MVEVAVIIMIFNYILIISNYYDYNMPVLYSKFYEYNWLRYDHITITICYGGVHEYHTNSQIAFPSPCELLPVTHP